MISRRNIRVKVMQLLYAMDTASEQTFGKKEPVAALKDMIDDAERLYFFLLYSITKVAAYAEQDAYLRASKNLPTTEDLNVNTKIAGNETVWLLQQNDSFKASESLLTKSLEENAPFYIKQVYNQLCATPEYRKYIAEEGRDPKSERRILEFLYSEVLLANEEYINFIETEFANFDDDIEMINQLLFATLHKPHSFDMNSFLPSESWQFGRLLLKSVIDKDDFLSDTIKPRLKNWDIDRIASIDIILIKMAIAEFLYFETIPTKVTINEYIDLAKEYSTEQSGQFVNGILDEIRKRLESENKIQKIDFKK